MFTRSRRAAGEAQQARRFARRFRRFTQMKKRESEADGRLDLQDGRESVSENPSGIVRFQWVVLLRIWEHQGSEEDGKGLSYD